MKKAILAEPGSHYCTLKTKTFYTGHQWQKRVTIPHYGAEQKQLHLVVVSLKCRIELCRSITGFAMQVNHWD